MEKLLLFGITDTEYDKIKQICNRMKLRCELIPASCYSYTLEQLLNTATGSLKSSAPDMPEIPSADSDGSTGSESLLVMCDLSDKRVDKLLFELRHAQAALDYKAVLTPTNKKWTVSQLLFEMHREKAAYQRMQPSYK